MPLHILNPRDGSILDTLYAGQHMDLVSDRIIHVDTVCQATVMNNFIVKVEGVVWLSRTPGVFKGLLIVNHGQVVDGPVETIVFNLTTHRIRIMPGDPLSRLVVINDSALAWRQFQ